MKAMSGHSARWLLALFPLSLAWLAASSSGQPWTGRPGLRALPEPQVFAISPPPPPQSATVREVVTGLWRLTSITSPGDARLILTQQDGLAWILADGVLQAEPFLDLRGQTNHVEEDEAGLLSLAFHPRFVQNRTFFACYTDQAGALTVARYKISAADPDRADPASRKVLLRIPKREANHNGGQLQFGPDGYLYLGTGDGAEGGDPGCQAQQGSTFFGKLLRLDVDAHAGSPPFYAVPNGNPFRKSRAMPGEVWAYGLRNPWRFSFDRLTGDLWIGDVGQGAREEIDLQPAGSRGGQNYGWKVMEGTACYSSSACPGSAPVCGSSRLTPPVLEYEHGQGDECAVTGGYVYRGTDLPHLYGLYLFGDLCSGRIWTAARKETAWQIRELDGRVKYLTSFGEDRQGELWMTTLDGRVFQLIAKHPIDTPGLYDAASGRFLLDDLFTGGTPDRNVRFGPRSTAWLPVAGDWDGDGRTGIGLWDPETGTFRLRNKLVRGPAEATATLSPPSPDTVPLAGDWDGDGRDTPGLYDPRTSTFTLGTIPFVFGDPGAGLLPIAGDWDGDGRDSVGLYDPKTGAFFLRNALASGPADLEVRFGPIGKAWLPLAGDWNGDGRDDIGLFDPATSTFRLRNTLRSGPADVTVRLGNAGAGWLPIAGEW